MVPRVSVVIPAYNCGQFLRPAALSVLACAKDGAEAIVVDDGSTDGSVAALADLPVRVVKQPRNMGLGAARNAGVSAAKGAFVTFLDGDDLLTAEGLAPRVGYLESVPGAWGVGGLPSTLIDERGALMGEVFKKMRAKLAFPLNLTMTRYREGHFFPVQCSLYLYHRSTFKRVGPFVERRDYPEDYDFHLRLLAQTSVPVIPVPTFERRLHGSNLSMAGAKPREFSFKAGLLGEIRNLNEQYGMKPSEVTPWELDYL